MLIQVLLHEQWQQQIGLLYVRARTGAAMRPNPLLETLNNTV